MWPQKHWFACGLPLLCRSDHFSPRTPTTTTHNIHLISSHSITSNFFTFFYLHLKTNGPFTLVETPEALALGLGLRLVRSQSKEATEKGTSRQLR